MIQIDQQVVVALWSITGVASVAAMFLGRILWTMEKRISRLEWKLGFEGGKAQ